MQSFVVNIYVLGQQMLARPKLRNRFSFPDHMQGAAVNNQLSQRGLEL